MKKLLILFTVLIMCFAVAGCTMDNPPKKEILSTDEIVQTNGIETEGQEKDVLLSDKTVLTGETGLKEQENNDFFALNETAVFDSLKITATEIEESTGKGEYFGPETGNVFVGIKFTIENISDEEQSISSYLMFDGYVDDIKNSYSYGAATEFSDSLLDGTIAPGKKMVGWYGMEVPENWSSIELQVKSDWFSDSKAKFLFNK